MKNHLTTRPGLPAILAATGLTPLLKLSASNILCRSSHWRVWVAIGLVALAPSLARPQESAPNIVFILADDLGWSDLGCYGNRYSETPVIDHLAADGMRFTSAYTAPVCTPSRGMILSGQYSARTGVYKTPFMPNDRPWAKIIPPTNWGNHPVQGTSLGQWLAGMGYATELIGKADAAPAFLEGMHVVWRDFAPSIGADQAERGAQIATILGADFSARVNRFTRANPGKFVGPVTQEAIRFIAVNKDRPFFCYVGHYAPHVPLEARDELKRKYEKKWRSFPAAIHPHYAAMCQALDESVGLILETLDRLHLSDRTVVMFFSDNGGVKRIFNDGQGAQITDLSPLRGEKGGLYEGSIRVPLIVRWPGQIKPGSVCDTPVISTDFLPTMAALAGKPLTPNIITDGTNLVPLLTGTGPLKRERLFFYFPDYHHDFPAMAVREDRYKLIESAEDGHLELYDLAADIGEQHNLAAQSAAKAADLAQALHQWRESLHAPLPAPNPHFDPEKQHLLDPHGETLRKEFFPIPWPPPGEAGTD
ncbi:MAG: sulfatase [Opitutaceae bacterium]